MPCIPARFPDGSSAIVCTRGRRPKPCVHCRQPSSRLCDFPVERNGKAGTCDAALCARCTWAISGDRDLCRAHVKEWAGEWGPAGRPLGDPA